VPYKVQENGSIEYILPPADAVIDPKIPESVTGRAGYPFPDICGAVVAFKICQLYAERLWGKGSDKYRELVRYLLPFAGLATVCDVMPLADENRILVREGLGEASFSNNLGLQSLLTVNGLTGTPLTTYHAGFVIGPCLNATGRLDSAYRGLELFMEQNPSAALQSAQQLKELNDSRKSMTVEGTEAAEAMIESEGMGDRRVLVLLLRDCHESLAGIIAGRIKESRHRPTFVLTDTGNGLLKGSGRSIESYDMYAQMNACEDLFVKYGGHKMAGGLTMKEEDFEEFSRRIEENCTLTDEDLQEVVRVDMELPPRFLSLPVTRELDLLEPCGTQNPKPLFVTRNIRLLSARVMGKSRNVIRFAAQDDSGYGMELILFGDAQIFVQNIEESLGSGAFEDLLRGAGNVTIDMVYYPDINVWRDRESLQYIIKDYRIHN
jgi:single-stranded-DNA-specific exonuclease